MRAWGKVPHSNLIAKPVSVSRFMGTHQFNEKLLGAQVPGAFPPQSGNDK